MKQLLVMSVLLFLGVIKPFTEPVSLSVKREVALPERPSLAVPAKYYNMVSIVCNFYDIPTFLFCKLLEVESNFNPKAVGGPNADGTYDYGIAQLNSAYIEEFGWRYKFGKIDPFNAEQSIHVAAKHLSVLYEHTGSWERAVAAYNCGLARVQSNRIPLRTREYVDKIFGRSKT
jgi:soluble lytic murein transglycosylase-like protein